MLIKSKHCIVEHAIAMPVVPFLPYLLFPLVVKYKNQANLINIKMCYIVSLKYYFQRSTMDSRYIIFTYMCVGIFMYKLRISESRCTQPFRSLFFYNFTPLFIFSALHLQAMILFLYGYMGIRMMTNYCK